jgi:hypothetical protein
MAEESMKHENIVWNPATRLWFCAKCGQTSGQVDEKAAQLELELRQCHLPWVEVRTAASNPPAD